MGRQLGAFDPDDALERPDLNKCPDCGCYFADTCCPLCGKECPPEMRAGARVEPKKKRKNTRNSSGRVMFVSWYHQWWVILIAMFVFPIAGIILMATSPYAKKWKVTVIVPAVLVFALAYTGIGSALLADVLWKPDNAVNQSLSVEEYRETCVPVEADVFFRRDDGIGYHTMTLTVIASIDTQTYESPFGEYGDVAAGYLCHAPGDPDAVIFVADCRASGRTSLKAGDTVTVWGQTDEYGPVPYTAGDKTYTGPCLYAAYMELVQ